MADETGPNLLVVGGDSKRLQWLTHHVTSHWPDAQVTTVPAEESASLSRLIVERAPDAVILQANFAEETPITQYADRGFLAPFGNNGESHLAGLQINTASTGPPCAKKVCF